jgi:hypothetical protein
MALKKIQVAPLVSRRAGFLANRDSTIYVYTRAPKVDRGRGFIPSISVFLAASGAVIAITVLRVSASASQVFCLDHHLVF